MSGRRAAFAAMPGELVLEEAAGVRQRCGEGGGSIPGTLLCTNRRVAFLPAQAHGSCALLHGEDDVALPCIRKLVAASSFTKPKVLTATSTLKFIPEELAVFCRDFRLLRFQFHEDGLAPQAFRVANAIARAREAAAWMVDVSEGHHGCSCPVRAPLEEEEEEEEDEDLAATLLFESLQDWETELKRLGTEGWRVSAVNERFDMAPSLPRYLWVPSGLLDHDLKRTFAHFEERRVPRLCWMHPGGAALLRAASFHPASEPGSEDVRCLEALLLGGRGPCVLADAAELPTLADIQLAHLKLRALCLPGAVVEEKWLSALEGTRWLEHVRTCLRRAVEVASLLAGRRCSVLLQEPSDRDLNCLLASVVQLLADPRSRTLPGFQSLIQREWVAAGHPFPRRLGLLRRDTPREEAPVFLLFLDCTWQLLRQFPAAFGFTEAYLLALHDSSFAPYFSTFGFSCQRQRRSAHRPHGQTYTPVRVWRDPQPGVPWAGSAAGGLPTVWDWGLRYSRQQRARFRNPASAAGTVGPPDTGTVGPHNTGTVGPPNTSTVGPPDTSTVGPPDISTVGPPDTGRVGPPNIGTVGTPDTSTVGPPDIGTVGPPDIGTVGPPDTGTVGPSNTSTTGPPNTGSVGCTGTMGPPNTDTTGPLNTGTVGLPNTSTMRPTGIMGHPSTGSVGCAGSLGHPNTGMPPEACPALGTGNVLVLAKGTLYPQPLPWRSSRPAPRLARWPPSLENLGGSVGGSRPPVSPPELLLPCAASPSVRLWRRCYLRGLPEAQRGRFSPSPAGLAEELMLLQDRLRAWRPAGSCAEASGRPLAPSR
ncbi:myotubularin-related protein 11 [Cuculus canorus]|uniref:myotubularin-related protein 11 n=1 Tax=Cuculus canorus TaxID=55661 RepID=UPI0023AA83AE|nr:myotubularin-related protein 11 [Cuculus canorus]